MLQPYFKIGLNKCVHFSFYWCPSEGELDYDIQHEIRPISFVSNNGQN